MKAWLFKCIFVRASKCQGEIRWDCFMVSVSKLNSPASCVCSLCPCTITCSVLKPGACSEQISPGCRKAPEDQKGTVYPGFKREPICDTGLYKAAV